MGIKLEYLLTILIIGTLSFFLMMKVEKHSPPKEVGQKELEFKNTLLVEVTTDTVKSYIYSTYGKRENSVMTLDNIIYMSPNIKSIVAKKAQIEGHLLYLDGDVVLQEKEGYRYETQHAMYNDDTKILKITSPFVGVKGDNTIEGETLEYDTRKKKATSLSVGTVFDIPDK
jgi:lipopolysaccharide assembly outer membrane protein LptD (OstA)